MNAIAAILYAVALSVLVGLGLAFRPGGITPDAAALALAVGTLTGVLAWWRGRRHVRKLEPPRGWQWVPVVLYALFACRAFLWLIWRQGDELRVLSPNNLGDMSLHLSFIEYFRSGTSFWPDSPIYSGGKLSYGIGMDFFNALLTQIGVDTIHGLVWVGLVGAILAGVALWRWGGAFTLMGFLCLGGLLGFAAFAQRGDPFFQDYAGQLKYDAAWKSLPLALFVTQRGFLFALPAGLLLLSSWRSRFFGGGDGWRLPFLGELLLYAVMPIFHAHTFIALSFMLGAFFVCHAGARWRLTALIGCALIPATVLLWFSTGMGQSTVVPMWGNMSDVEHPPDRPLPHVLGWEPGWMVNEPPRQGADAWGAVTGGRPTIFDAHGRFLFFWLGNFGLWPFVAGALVLALLRPLSRGPVPARWAWWCALAFVLLTPLLGQWTAYQQDSLSDFLTGHDPASTGRHIALSLLAAATLVCAWMVCPVSGPLRALRFAGFGLVALVMLNAALLVLHTRVPKLPLLAANALPLLAATAALVILLCLLARRWADPLWPAAFVFPALYLFFLSCNVKFAPWAWDNTKVMIWAVLIVMPFLWEQLIIRWPWPLRAGACTLLFFSGFVGLLGGLDGNHQGYPIASLAQLDSVRVAVRVVPPTEPIAAAPIWNHPLLLIGRRVVLGYTGHVESHGLPAQWHFSRLNTLMNGGDEWRLAAAELGVRYLWWGPEEELQWPRSRQSWRRAAQVIIHNPAGELFDLDLPLVPVDQ